MMRRDQVDPLIEDLYSIDDLEVLLKIEANLKRHITTLSRTIPFDKLNLDWREHGGHLYTEYKGIPVKIRIKGPRCFCVCTDPFRSGQYGERIWFSDLLKTEAFIIRWIDGWKNPIRGIR
jgi:hypothetical protein